MATPTTFYNLLKALVGETYDVNLTNNNLDKIDTALNTNLHLIRHTEFTAASVSQTANNGVIFGALTEDTAVKFNNTFVSSPGGGQLKALEAGIYQVDVVAMPATNPGTSCQLFATRSGSASDNVLSENFNGYGSNQVTGSFSVYLAVNDLITFGITGSNTFNTTARLKITKTQG